MGECGVSGICAGAVHFVGVCVWWVEEVDDGMIAGAAHCEEVVGVVVCECVCIMCWYVCGVSGWVLSVVRMVADPDLRDVTAFPLSWWCNGAVRLCVCSLFFGLFQKSLP